MSRRRWSEEEIERRGTDSDGSGLDLNLPPKMSAEAADRMFDERTSEALKKTPAESPSSNPIAKKIREGWRVDTAKVGPAGTRLVQLKFPI
jgi:hypothetical protein